MRYSLLISRSSPESAVSSFITTLHRTFIYSKHHYPDPNFGIPFVRLKTSRTFSSGYCRHVRLIAIKYCVRCTECPDACIRILACPRPLETIACALENASYSTRLEFLNDTLDGCVGTSSEEKQSGNDNDLAMSVHVHSFPVISLPRDYLQY